MNTDIKAAIEESIDHNMIAHVHIGIGDIHVALAGVDYDDAVEAEPGTYDVWGTEDCGEEWRICIHTYEA